MVIRPALPTDAPALATLGERLWRETYAGLIPDANLELHLAKTFGLAQQTAELTDPACRTLVLTDASVPLGYALLRSTRPATPDLPFERPLEVARFYLDRRLHGTGAALRLMQAVLALAGSEGHDGVWLQVWEQNPRARRFYDKAGFTEVGEATFRVGEKVDRDRVLARGFLVLQEGLALTP